MAARVELHSNCQTISVDRSHIASIGVPSKDGSISSYNRTPSFGGATPIYAAGQKTPLHGSQTPMYEPGSRTPHYGSMTPSHDGSRTPGQSGAWDANVTNTPARSTDFEGYSLDEASPSPGYNPSTPGYQAGGPYTPQTPGGTMYGSDHSYSPYQPSPSPSGFQGGSYTGTPSPGGGYTPSPSGAPPYATPSIQYSPMTLGKLGLKIVNNFRDITYLPSRRKRFGAKSVQPPDARCRFGHSITGLAYNRHRSPHSRHS